MGWRRAIHLPLLRRQVGTQGELQPLCVQGTIKPFPVEADEPMYELWESNEISELLHLLRMSPSGRNPEHVLPPSGLEMRSPRTEHRTGAF
jgi:hypothetical protein